MIKIALFQPDIAGNVGTIMRTCACLDIELHIIEPCGFVFDLQKIKKSALDYIDHVTIFRHNSFDDFYQAQIIQNPQNRLVLLTTKTTTSYLDFNFRNNDILLLGRESAGVPEEVANKVDAKVKILMEGKMRSLNVAISAAMVLGETIRQIKK
ncbi:MAG: tRNA ((34)-2-O)-methyltransferase [Rickettsiaceae bacterium]|jgi:tRNA (cytidine/uridine-2'-O-)-methyltransferase|nr:tRNA ((34)-2-O)-methyltransferase [Rickettsiaceae bacterium]